MDKIFQKTLEQASDLTDDEEYEEAMLLYDKVLDSDPRIFLHYWTKQQPYKEWKKIHNLFKFTL